ncbi:unnamed protein product [Albugo candida]|uniref:Cytochrome P450 n=1 Tax=Albugo candida TaxID=65357 RepID=A0A024GU72_9STRA|nr:unnamed protein product [Albugo candida]|eukprot:CCI50351.1 unnamed protein product [Albugo candida]
MSLFSLLTPQIVFQALGILFLMNVLILRPLQSFHRKLRIAKGLAPVPGPRGVWVLGMIPSFLRNNHRIYDFLEELLKIYNGRMKTPWHIFFDGGLYVSSPQDVKHMLADNVDNYIKPQGFLDAFHEIFQNAFFATNHGPHAPDKGLHWKLQRKVAVKIFTANQFRTFTEQVFKKRAQSILSRVQVTRLEDRSVLQCDMQQLSSEFTLESIFQIAFGIDLSAILEPQQFARYCNFVNEHCASRLFFNQYYKWFWWCMPSEWKLWRYTKRIQSIADSILHNRMRLDPEVVAKQSDLLSLFINKTREKDVQVTKLLSPNVLRSIILTFIFAGRDTTSECITYTFYALARNPHIQEKIRQELYQALGENSSSVSLTYENIKMLRYLDAVVHETLRLYPALPYNLKVAVEDDILPDQTFVPAGTYMYYSPWYMGRNEKFWGPDAHVFRPERWLEMERRPTAYEFPVFQAGPRTCIGMAMAIVEVKVFTAVILMEHFVKIQDGHDVDRDYILKSGLYMKEGLPLDLIPLPKHAVVH